MRMRKFARTGKGLEAEEKAVQLRLAEAEKKQKPLAI